MNEQADLTFEQAAMILRVTRQTVYNWAGTGDAPIDVVNAQIEKREKELAEIKQNLGYFRTATPAASPTEG